MVSWRSILRGAVTRFIPGVGTFLGVGYFVNASRGELTLATTQVAGFATLALWCTVGFVVTLGILRARLHDTAHIDGRRSYIAGLCTVAMLLATDVLYAAPVPRSAMWAIVTVAGALATFAVFFSRLRARMAQLERTENGQLYADVVEFAERGTPRDNARIRVSRST